MVGTYNRNKAKREHQQVALEHVASHKEVLVAKEIEDRDYEDDLVRRMEERGEDPLQMTGKDMDDLHDALDRAQGKRIPYRFPTENDQGGEVSHHALADEADRDLQGSRSLEKMLSEMPCSACLCKHNPSADCPADEDVRRHNESQQDPRDLDMYHDYDF